MLRDRPAVLLKDGIEIKDHDSQCVASSSRLKLVHFGEHRLSESWFSHSHSHSHSHCYSPVVQSVLVSPLI
ncbi:hypothetical protein OIU84_002936 [Salix udensis]|uniref:Uncharacterized protein n=1 Tax=Salix udensis TaxID=889485 RepID=A0AAD6P5W8_9ROSI|nr:hypothetical protein OIU84_002936 [Salix udensis]